ncbi:MAG: hypothetical protein PHT00_00535 [Candidatus Methanomethylophilus sp.]|nr:hypothetical protein [Methanomethylophilus sp.]MDD4222063.1 hypothetical protein [Methanomethylophilus sp.]MDD4668529.1 hypothetical protein [Methanomethylophilus sp.]
MCGVLSTFPFDGGTLGCLVVAGEIWTIVATRGGLLLRIMTVGTSGIDGARCAWVVQQQRSGRFRRSAGFDGMSENAPAGRRGRICSGTSADLAVGFIRL